MVCARPILHPLELARLHDLAAVSRERTPALELRLWLRSDLADDGPFRRLHFDRIARLPRSFRPGALEGRLGEACVLVGEDAGQELELRQDPAIRWLATVPLGFRGRFSADAETAARAFQCAVRAASPRWTTAPGAPFLAELPAAPRFLFHQARFHIGDILWLTPLLRALKHRFAGARVTVVGPPVAEDVLADNPDVAEVVVWPKSGGVEQRRGVVDAVFGQRLDAALFAFARRPESEWLARAAMEAGVPVRVDRSQVYSFQCS